MADSEDKFTGTKITQASVFEAVQVKKKNGKRKIYKKNGFRSTSRDTILLNEIARIQTTVCLTLKFVMTSLEICVQKVDD